MVLITKDEKEIIRKQFPKACIVRTVKSKSNRHRYYCEEYPPVMRLLKKLRGIEDTQPRDNKRRGKGGKR